MASQDVQSFFQPLSAWMSRVYEALQQAGDSLSSSLVNLNSKEDRHEGDEGLEDSDGSYNACSEASDDDSDFSQNSDEFDPSLSSAYDPASLESSSASSLGPHWQEGDRNGCDILEQYLDDDSLLSRGVYRGHQPMETIPEEDEQLSSRQVKNHPCNWGGQRTCLVENSSQNSSTAGKSTLCSLTAAL